MTTSATSLVNSPTAHFENVTSVDVLDVLTYLFAHKWKILFIAAVVFTVAAFRAYTEAPIYQAKALLEVGQKKMGAGTGGINVMLIFLVQEDRGQVIRESLFFNPIIL